MAGLSTYNLEQLLRQAHSVWQNISQMTAWAKESGHIPYQSDYEQEAVQDKMQETQILLSLARRSYGELEDMIREMKDRRDGVDTPLTGQRILEIESLLKLPVAGEPDFRQQEVDKACIQLLKEVKQKEEFQTFTGNNIIPLNRK